MDKKRIIFHIDANSAFLSWEAAERLKCGEGIDIRNELTAIGGDVETRHGIILAKSIETKKYGIKTGESIYSALKKCPNLIIFPPRMEVYKKYSEKMFEIIREYSPKIERYSIDEGFVDYTGMENLLGDYKKASLEIKNRIKDELNFTVNIGISENKLLAKMASDFEKPDKIHTLFFEEIKYKMWPLPIENLFMAGNAISKNFRKYNINTIGDLANSNKVFIKSKFKLHGEMLWNYANGIDESEVLETARMDRKSISNSITLPYDLVDKKNAHLLIYEITEGLVMKLRGMGKFCTVVSINIKNSDFKTYSKQQTIEATTSTKFISKFAIGLFDEVWKGEPIRLLGVTLSQLTDERYKQISLLEEENLDKYEKLDSVLDNIKKKYGNTSIIRSSLIKKKEK